MSNLLKDSVKSLLPARTLRNAIVLLTRFRHFPKSYSHLCSNTNTRPQDENEMKRHCLYGWPVHTSDSLGGPYTLRVSSATSSPIPHVILCIFPASMLWNASNLRLCHSKLVHTRPPASRNAVSVPGRRK